MRRIFLSHFIATSLSLVFSTRELTSRPLNDSQDTGATDGVVGKWHLLRSGENEFPVPNHRMDLLFKTEGGQLRGAILSRTTGEEIPLAFAKFDGSTLQLQMKAPAEQEQPAMPTLAMKKTGAMFEGHWMKSATEPVGPLLKLIRARK